MTHTTNNNAKIYIYIYIYIYNLHTEESWVEKVGNAPPPAEISPLEEDSARVELPNLPILTSQIGRDASGWDRSLGLARAVARILGPAHAASQEVSNRGISMARPLEL